MLLSGVVSGSGSRCPMLGTYRNLENQLLAAIVGCQGVENWWKLFTFELDCN